MFSSKKAQLKSAAQPHHVLERAAELDGGNLVNGVDAEGLHVEELVEQLARLLVRRADRGLAEITPGHLVCGWDQNLATFCKISTILIKKFQ